MCFRHGNAVYSAFCDLHKHICLSVVVSTSLFLWYCVPQNVDLLFQ